MLNEDYLNEKEFDEDLFLWFTESMKSDQDEITRFWNIKKSYLEIIKINESMNVPTDLAEEKFRENHFDQLRKITEHYYKIRVYLPCLFRVYTKKRWNKFNLLIYEKIQDLYEKLTACDFEKLTFPKTSDEKRIVQILLEELLNTEDIIIPHLPKKYTRKHFVKCVTEEPYRIMKSENHILFAYGDEELNEKTKYTSEEPIKVMKSKNHMLFLYNE